MTTITKPLARRRVESRQMSEEEWGALMAEPASSDTYLGADRRAEERRPHREILHFFVALSLADRVRKRYLVRTRNISRMGVGFLHSQEAVRGTRCRVAMLSLDEHLVQVNGKVASCRQQRDGLYAVGVVFDHPLEIGQFVPQLKPTG
jgi:hypothetical protein